jgi:hypothetical protein
MLKLIYSIFLKFDLFHKLIQREFRINMGDFYA